VSGRFSQATPMQNLDSTKHEALMKSEAERIVAEARKRNLHLRLLGALAFQLHCPKHVYLAKKLGRVLSDIDFAAYGKERDEINKMMREFRYTDEGMVTALFGHTRMIWDNKSNGMHVDVFFDKLEMNHEIPFANRLEIDEWTIPLADMLLEKMQIVHMNEKDVVDTIMLLREHPVGDGTPDTIDIRYIATTLAKDWGFYYTVTENLRKIQNRLSSFPELGDEDRRDISGKIQAMLKIIEDEPKTTSWKIRARVGTKKKWYREVEDVVR
jgi:hypothetical protein